MLDAGFDYVELPAAATVGSQDFDPSSISGLPVEATNLFFPSSFRLFGERPSPYMDYARYAAERAGSVGVRTMVLGSGAARRAPDDTDAEGAFVRIAARIAAVARDYGVAVAPEALNEIETNVGNDLGTLARELRKVGVGYTADVYHAIVAWESHLPDEPTYAYWQWQLPFCPAHVHVADRSRRPPKPDDATVGGFARRLHELGYQGRVSLECALADPRAALRDLKEIFGS